MSYPDKGATGGIARLSEFTGPTVNTQAGGGKELPYFSILKPDVDPALTTALTLSLIHI